MQVQIGLANRKDFSQCVGKGFKLRRLATRGLGTSRAGHLHLTVGAFAPTSHKSTKNGDAAKGARMQCKVGPYEPSYYLREEARKSWNYAVSDKVVYHLDPIESTFNSFSGFSKEYVEGNVWIEGHLSLQIKGCDYHGVVVIESQATEVGLRKKRKPKIRSASSDVDSVVFVNNMKRIQLPKKMTPNGDSIIGVPSIIRLKFLNHVTCSCGHAVSHVKKLFFVGGLQNRKLDLFFRVPTDGSQLTQAPIQLIEGGSQTVQQVTKDEGNPVRRVINGNANTELSFFEVVLSHKGAGFRFIEGVDMLTQGFKMFLRPGGFQIGIS